VANGGLPAAKTLVDKALASEDPVLRPAALGAVGSSGKEEIAHWLLDAFKDDRLRPSENRGLMASVIQTGSTRDFGYKWLHDHLDQVIQGGGIFYAAKLPATLNGFCSAEKADEIARDLRPRFAGKTGELELERTIERVRNCGMLKDARRAEVSKAIAALR
jgi:hypothetical protein